MGGLPQTTLRWTEQVLACVARYTHRVAISNDRLIAIGAGKVPFRWRVSAVVTSTRLWRWLLRSSSAASFSTSSSRASGASAITASLAIAAENRSWPARPGNLRAYVCDGAAPPN